MQRFVLLLTLLTLSCLSRASGQAITKTPATKPGSLPAPAFSFSYQGMDLSQFLSRETRYPAELRFSTDSCKRLVFGFCVSFVVEWQGKVGHIRFSEQVAAPVQKEISRVLNLTSSHWKPIGNSAAQTMFLPVIYQRDDCLKRPMEGFSGQEYSQAFAHVFAFLASGGAKGSHAVLPLLEVTGYAKN